VRPGRIRFCRSADGARIAFASTGEGPLLVQAPTWLTHLELDWTSAAWRPWIDELIARGRSNAEIAEDLRIRPKTVRNHITSLFRKMGVSRRAEAIVRAREAGLGRHA